MHSLAKLTAKPYPNRMPKGPKGERRPADAIGAAIMVARIATGEVQEGEDTRELTPNRKGGLRGGRARAEKLSPELRAFIAKKAANKRWGKKN